MYHFFIGGYFAVRYERLSEKTFITFATIAGGLASVIGLLSLVRPSITKTDIQQLELDSLKRISRTAEELEQFQNQRNATQEEIAQLNLQKEEMAFLVRKASLSLCINDQIDRRQKHILEILISNEELSRSIDEYGKIREKLIALSEEIATDKNVDLLVEIIRPAELEGLKKRETSK